METIFLFAIIVLIVIAFSGKKKPVNTPPKHQKPTPKSEKQLKDELVQPLPIHKKPTVKGGQKLKDESVNPPSPLLQNTIPKIEQQLKEELVNPPSPLLQNTIPKSDLQLKDELGNPPSPIPQNQTPKSEQQVEDELVNSIFKNIKITVTTSSSSSSYSDDSIIDVTDKSYKLNANNNLKKYSNGVPYWAHHYVYSYSEINGATAEQKKFYSFFKNSFLNSEYLDLEGNTNYSFILLFDLLNEYETHKDIPKLEKQLQALGQCYPKTKSYGVSFLIQKMEGNGDNEGVSRLKTEERNSYQRYNNDYDYWRLGSKYKTKLNLTEDDVILLNKLWYPSNNFCNIEFCLIEILKLYINTIKGLTEKYVLEGTTLNTQFLAVADVIARKQYKYKLGSNNYKYSIDSTTNAFYSNIFKYCENAVREFYGHKRKINTDPFYTVAEAKSEFELKIISKVTELLPTLILKVASLDEATDIELYSQNTNRWKIKFEELTTSYNNNSKQFIDSIIALGNLNKKNPSIENIFFEASKFISKSDKTAALIFYIHYLYHDLKSATFDNKPLTKTIQKSLFKTNEQLHDFEIVVSELIKDKNLEKAVQRVTEIYQIRRKKIELDTTLIKEVQQQDSGAVELLNVYLKDDYEDEYNTIRTEEINNDEVAIQITQKTESAVNSIYINTIRFTELQITTLEIFAKSNFSVPEGDLEKFAKSKGVFKNQLVENINETCYEILDDVLIEQEEDYYNINLNYYQRLLAL